MTHYDVRRLALVFAVQAEIEGMKALNMERDAQNLALTYTEENFLQEAENLRMLASAHDEQL